MEVSGKLHAPAALPPGKGHRYSLDRKLGGAHIRSERGGAEKNSHPLPGLEPSVIQPAARRYTTEVSLFLLPFSTTLIIKSPLLGRQTFVCETGVSQVKVIVTVNYEKF
jgi:hypothetical protein